MSLQRLTVLTKNGDSSAAGTVLFNSKYMENVKTIDAGTFFYYRDTAIDSDPDKYVVSDVLATVDGIFAETSDPYTVATFRDDVNDSASDTTNKILDLDDIIKGIALPSDVTQSLLWIDKGGKNVEKVLVDKFLKALSDLASTGTTTTYE